MLQELKDGFLNVEILSRFSEMQDCEVCPSCGLLISGEHLNGLSESFCCTQRKDVAKQKDKLRCLLVLIIGQ